MRIQTYICNEKSLLVTWHVFALIQVLLSDARAGVKRQYAAIREALEQEEQSALQCVVKEEKRVLGGLEEKLSHLRTSLQSVQHGLHTLESLADAKGDKRIQDQAFIMVSWILGGKNIFMGKTEDACVGF